MSAPDYDVIHRWWIPALGGKFDAIPGATNETWFNADGARHLPRPVRRALRHPARAHDGLGRGDAAPTSSTPGSTREAGAQAAGTSSLGKETFTRRLREVPRARGRGRRRPALGREPAARGRRRRSSRSSATAAARCRRSGKDWTDRQIDALDRLPPEGGAPWPLTPRRPIPAWQRGRFASWLVTVDHKRIGILYLATRGFFFVAGGIMALLIRTQLAHAERALHRARQPTTSSSRCTGRRWSSSSSSRSSPGSPTTSCR